MNDQSIMSDLIPLKMCSSIQVLDQYEENWLLAQVDDCESPQPRSFEYYIPFENPFSTSPVVHAGIAGLDIDNRDTARLSLRITEITPEGFRVAIETWRHTIVYKVEVSWLALGSA